jgi:hypothetical protein
MNAKCNEGLIYLTLNAKPAEPGKYLYVPIIPGGKSCEIIVTVERNFTGGFSFYFRDTAGNLTQFRPGRGYWGKFKTELSGK